jgi:excisionase family DNA binding protein
MNAPLQDRLHRPERVNDPISDFAASVGISVSLTWKLISQGKIKPIRIGRRTLIPRTERDRFLSELQEAS